MRSLDEYRRDHPFPVKDTMPLRQIEREAVRLEALTGDETWDYFLSYLESALKATERARDSTDHQLRSPSLVNDEAVRALRVQIACLQTRMDTIKEILLLPKFLKERGQLAKAKIADLAKGA